MPMETPNSCASDITSRVSSALARHSHGPRNARCIVHFRGGSVDAETMDWTGIRRVVTADIEGVTVEVVGYRFFRDPTLPFTPDADGQRREPYQAIAKARLEDLLGTVEQSADGWTASFTERLDVPWCLGADQTEDFAMTAASTVAEAQRVSERYRDRWAEADAQFTELADALARNLSADASGASSPRKVHQAATCPPYAP